MDRAPTSAHKAEGIKVVGQLEGMSLGTRPNSALSPRRAFSFFKN